MYWDDDQFSFLARLASVVMSTLFPFVAILVLYYIHNTSIRLIMVFCFSLTFSLALVMFTTAKSVEIFAATAA